MDLSDGKPGAAGASDDASGGETSSGDGTTADRQSDATCEISDDEFVRQYHWLVVRIVREELALAGGRPAPSDVRDDLVADGWEGLAQARNSYDPNHEKRASFKTYAEIKIRSAVKAGLLRVHGRKRRGQLHTVSLDAAPDAVTGVAAQVEAIRTLVGPAAKDIFHAGELFCAHALAAQSDQDLLTKVLIAEALATLTPRERCVIEHKYFRDGEFQCLAQEFGVSKFVISRLHDKVIAHLRELLTPREEPE